MQAKIAMRISWKVNTHKLQKKPRALLGNERIRREMNCIGRSPIQCVYYNPLYTTDTHLSSFYHFSFAFHVYLFLYFGSFFLQLLPPLKSFFFLLLSFRIVVIGLGSIEDESYRYLRDFFSIFPYLSHDFSYLQPMCMHTHTHIIVSGKNYFLKWRTNAHKHTHTIGKD